MIKYDFNPSRTLLTNFSKEVISPTLSKMAEFLKTVPLSHRQTFSDVFSDWMVKELLQCKPELLVAHIHRVYSELPILADRYWPSYLLADIKIPANISTYKCQTKDEKAGIDVILTCAVDYLKHRITAGLVFIPSLLDLLVNAKTYSAKKSALQRVYNVAYGDIRATKKHLEIFPVWINTFEDVFSYSSLSSLMGLAIVQEWNINVCLYCNNESIQTRGDKIKLRADLDHFYPQTKFPFLAVTLSNLVPAGSFCNQGYKKSHHMLDYEHPFVLGVNDARLFHIIYPTGGRVESNNYSVAVFSQAGKLDKNIEGFEIKHLYSTQEHIKTWVSIAYEAVEVIRGLNYAAHTPTLLKALVDSSKSPHLELAKKFKADSINQFAEMELVTYP